MTITVVLFDLDDTLFAHRYAVDTAIARFLDTDDPAEVTRWHELEELHYPRYLSGELGLIPQRRVRSRAMAAPYGLALSTDAEADDWYDRYFVEYKRAWALHDDTIPCLDALDAAGLRIGLITNGDLAFQTEKLEATGLDARLEHVIASGEVGVAKPDARIFAIACERFGVAPSQAVYVGDRLQTDAAGAAKAGLTGVWLDRSGAGAVDEAAAPDPAAGIRIITTLAELPGMLA
ncbi:putative hydrolase of the HAD superfamily [Salinibacterium sp. CAN_S4]|uniref:HAD family hydrolase n=1 Tax=Salinibacterium sp. CAN_S4 TaxID=2787727 RepID=UPI0018EF9358